MNVDWELFRIGCGIALGAVMVSCPLWIPIYYKWRFKKECDKINRVQKHLR